MPSPTPAAPLPPPCRRRWHMRLAACLRAPDPAHPRAHRRMSLQSHPVLNLSFRSATPGSVGSPGGLGSPMSLRDEAPAATAADDDPAGIAIGAPDSRQLLEPLLRGKPKAGPSRLGAPQEPPAHEQLPVALLEYSPDASKGSSFASLVVILSKTIVGAGQCGFGSEACRPWDALPCTARRVRACTTAACKPVSAAAGSAALPRAFVLLGLPLAGGFLLLMGYMTRERPALFLSLLWVAVHGGPWNPAVFDLLPARISC